MTYLLPVIFGFLASWQAYDLSRSLKSRTVQDSAFVADRDFEPTKAKVLIGLKSVWLVICLAGLAVSSFQAFE